MSEEALRCLLGIVDRWGGKVTWMEIPAGWKCVVTGIELPPHIGVGATPAKALLEVLRFAMVLR